MTMFTFQRQEPEAEMRFEKLRKVRAMFQFITRALSKPTKPSSPHANVDPETIRGIVSHGSHGNVRLQNGRFYTKKDVDEQYARLKDVNFVG
jgi:hypothetical protein